MTYRAVGSILMPFEGPPEPGPSWLPNVTEEMESAAAKLFAEDKSGRTLMPFRFQDKAVRLKFLRMAGYQG